MHWSPFKKFGFNFMAIYFLLYCLSNQFLPSGLLAPIWKSIVPWFAKNVIGISREFQMAPTGSGDTTFDYVSLVVFAAIALIVGLIITLIDRNRINYNRALHWLVILIRYYLIYQMVLYGMAKLFYLQFQPPRHARLIQAYGDSSPMGLLWTFMGFSKGYTMFAGLGELVGGLLLLFRKTRMIGALVVFGVMANVMALNFFYDVPVKLLSTHIVVMSLILLSLDAKRLWNFFVANKATTSADIAPNFFKPEVEKVMTMLKWVAVVIGLGLFTLQSIQSLKRYGAQAEKPALYGLYETESFLRNGVDIPPLTTDQLRWRWLAIDWQDRAEIHTMNGDKYHMKFVPDSTLTTVAFSSYQDTVADILTISHPDSLHLLIEGVRRGDTLSILMEKKTKEDFLLMNRGYHWVSEYPHNR